MATLGSLARLIRSKNAGPWMLTIDIMFPDEDIYDLVLESGAVQAAEISRLINVPAQDLEIYFYAAANAIKISYPRSVPNGHRLDNDLFGGQQFAPLVELVIPLPTGADGVLVGSAAAEPICS